MSLELRIDRFSFFRGFIELSGLAADPDGGVASVALFVGGRRIAEGLARRGFGRRADDGAFSIRVLTDIDHAAFKDLKLVVRHGRGRRTVVTDIAGPAVFAGEGHRLFGRFLDWLNNEPAGDFLEIGARARSGNVRRQLVPEPWRYVGLDILAGENVDVVGDAHNLSEVFPQGRFKGLMSLSVFEHLAMPWKAAVEMNRVMTLGGRAFIGTHQTFPVHDEPWDYWRFSQYSWPSLFNARTGFRVVDAAVAEEVFVVAKRWHPGAHHGEAAGWALSSVVVEKVADAQVDWPVALSEITDTAYPA